MTDTRTGFVSTGRRKLHYVCSGNGPKLLIAFHGYGNEAGIFSDFVPFIEKDFTLYSIDLPHHGNSGWDAGDLLEKEELAHLAKELMTEMNTGSCSLMGYSLGGRVCLSIIEQLPGHIDKALLVAPDGLVFNPLYYFVTRNFAGKRLFRNFLNSPERYMRYINWLRDKKYVNASQYNFAKHYLDTPERRDFLLKVWPDMSRIIPNSRKLRGAIVKQHIPVYIFMGAYDRVIPVKHAEQFKTGLESVELHIAEKGHKVMDADTMPQMAECLLA